MPGNSKSAHRQIPVFMLLPYFNPITQLCWRTVSGSTSHIPSEYFLHPFLLCKFAQHLKKRCTWPFEKSKAIALFISQISQISGNMYTSVSKDLKINNLQTLSTLLSQLGIKLLRCCGEVRLFFFSHRTHFARRMFFHNRRTSSTLPIKFYPVVLSVISTTFTTLSICIVSASIPYLQFEGILILQPVLISKYKLI